MDRREMLARLGAGAVGEPGQRAFYIQARSESAQLTVLVEKEQVALLAAHDDLLAHHRADRGDGELGLRRLLLLLLRLECC